MFFLYANDLPPDVGFSLFSLPHIAMLTAISGLCYLAAKRCRAMPASAQQQMSCVRGLICLLWEGMRMAVYHAMGGLSIHELPLHLCGMAVFLCAAHSVCPADGLGQVLYTLCLPGAYAALLFPDWAIYPFFSFVALHSFSAHGLIVLYIVLQVAVGRIIPRLAALWKPILFLCAVVPAIVQFNRHFSTNYMFLELPSSDSPLMILSHLSGGNQMRYLAAFAIAALFVMLFMHLPFVLTSRQT